jgi:hypothetical protein
VSEADAIELHIVCKRLLPIGQRAGCGDYECLGYFCGFGSAPYLTYIDYLWGREDPPYPLTTFEGQKTNYDKGFYPRLAHPLTLETEYQSNRHKVVARLSTFNGEIGRFQCFVEDAPDWSALQSGLAACLIMATGFADTPAVSVHYTVSPDGAVSLASGLFEGDKR